MTGSVRGRSDYTGHCREREWDAQRAIASHSSSSPHGSLVQGFLHRIGIHVFDNVGRASQDERRHSIDTDCFRCYLLAPFATREAARNTFSSVSIWPNQSWCLVMTDSVNQSVYGEKGYRLMAVWVEVVCGWPSIVSTGTAGPSWRLTKLGVVEPADELFEREKTIGSSVKRCSDGMQTSSKGRVGREWILHSGSLVEGDHILRSILGPCQTSSTPKCFPQNLDMKSCPI